MHYVKGFLLQQYSTLLLIYTTTYCMYDPVKLAWPKQELLLQELESKVKPALSFNLRTRVARLLCLKVYATTVIS